MATGSPNSLGNGASCDAQTALFKIAGLTLAVRGNPEFHRTARLLLERHLPGLLDYARRIPEPDYRSGVYAVLAEMLLEAECWWPPGLTEEFAAGIHQDNAFHSVDKSVASYRRRHSLNHVLTALRAYDKKGGHTMRLHAVRTEEAV